MYSKESSRSCLECHKIFTPTSHNAKFCRNPITVDCLYCSEDVNTICADYKTNYCNPSCRNKHTRKSKYKIKSLRDCEICNKEFSPIASGQIICTKDHLKRCGFCSTFYIPSTQKYFNSNNRFCDSVCSTLDQTNSNIFKDRLSEYKNIDEWAIEFKRKTNRKPTKHDFSTYFRILRIPARANLELFAIKRESRFEHLVASYLEEYLKACEIDLNTRIERNFRPKHNDRQLELDVYIEALHIGFEVQDFKTHSKEETLELDPFGNFMKGPKYHEAKRSHFKELDIRVIDIWEDEIKDESFKKIVEVSVKEALERNLND